MIKHANDKLYVWYDIRYSTLMSVYEIFSNKSVFFSRTQQTFHDIRMLCEKYVRRSFR